MTRSAAIAAAAAITAVLAAAGSTAASAIEAAPAAATTAAASTWRITYTDPTLMSQFGAVAAFSGTNVWIEGGVTPVGSPNGQPDIRRWNGKSWTKVTLPTKYGTAQLSAMSASSASNVWVFGQYRDSTGQNPHTFALRWNGSGWSQVGQWLTYNVVYAATVVSSTDVWIFGSIGTWHYNGTGWKPYSLPFSINDASAVRSNDIWAVATDNATSAPKLAQWNGTSWKAISVPPIASSPPGPFLTGIVVNSASDLWAVGGTVTSTGVGVPLALHLTSGVWHQFHPVGRFQLGQVITDGTGGIWAAGLPGYANSVVLHYSAGKWTSVAMPTVSGKFSSINALGRVPGTTTIYGAGLLGWGGFPETEGLIVHN